MLGGGGASTLATLLDGLPVDFRSRISQVFMCDVAGRRAPQGPRLGRSELPGDLALTLIRQQRDLGYGGNQKAGYRLAIHQGLDILVLLRAGRQYAPESIVDLVARLERGDCDAAFGSRMMLEGAGHGVGIALHESAGNRLLTRFERRMLGINLTDLHPVCRAFSVMALKSIPFESNSDGFSFDIQLITQLVNAGKQITEVPMAAPIGDDSHLSGLRHAKDVSFAVLHDRAARLGFHTERVVTPDPQYQLKEGDGTSHGVILRWLASMAPARVLDLGCAAGLVAERARALGHKVTGVDLCELPGVHDRVDTFVQADLDAGLPDQVVKDGPFDVIVAADVLEHLREPERLLEQIKSVLATRGVLLVSVPNFGHWYARGRIALGLFDYDRRGILDVTHVRFFTRRGFLKQLRRAGYTAVREEVTGLPVGVLLHRRRGLMQRLLWGLDRCALLLRPTLFGYQFVWRCELSMEAITVTRQHA